MNFSYLNDYYNCLLLRKYELQCVVTVSVPFTRDYDSIRTKLPQLEEGDKTCIATALAGVNQLILNEWGYQTAIQIVLVCTLVIF